MSNNTSVVTAFLTAIVGEIYVFFKVLRKYKKFYKVYLCSNDLIAQTERLQKHKEAADEFFALAKEAAMKAHQELEEYKTAVRTELSKFEKEAVRTDEYVDSLNRKLRSLRIELQVEKNNHTWNLMQLCETIGRVNTGDESVFGLRHVAQTMLEERNKV